VVRRKKTPGGPKKPPNEVVNKLQQFVGAVVGENRQLVMSSLRMAKQTAAAAGLREEGNLKGDGGMV